MKPTHRTSSSLSALRRGFTLIELLVVISIVAVLAGLGFGGFKMAQDAAREASAKKTMSDLIMASDAFYDEYNYLPLSEGATSDTLQFSDNELMSVLTGKEQAASSNPKEVRFFNGQKAKGRGSSAYDGLYETDNEAVLYGPWRLKQENEKFYRVVYDYDYDDEIREQEGVGDEIIRGKRQIAYHLGKDGEAGNDQNADNIYSYK